MHVVFVITLIVYILKSKKTKPKKKKIGKWYSHTSQTYLNLWYNCVQEQKKLW